MSDMRVLRILAIAISLGLCLFSISYSQVEMGTACEPYGSVTISGSPAQDNMVVIAYVGDTELARTATSGGQYSFFIPLDDSGTPQRDGYRQGDIISIRINGNAATPAFEAFAGRQRRDVEVSPSEVRLETWGRIKALFR